MGVQRYENICEYGHEMGQTDDGYWVQYAEHEASLLEANRRHTVSQLTIRMRGDRIKALEKVIKNAMRILPLWAAGGVNYETATEEEYGETQALWMMEKHMREVMR